ncbi:MAG: molybdopterin cofactor-binding domain-containing protein, partial [Pseudomonadales bacterium]
TTGVSFSENVLEEQSDSEKYDFDNTESYALADVVAGYDEQKVSAKGQIKPGKNGKKYRQSSFGANFAEVAVHKVTGEIRVKRMTGAFAAGRILNHKTATSQCYGGMVFGIGSALMEEVIHDKRDGRLCNHDLAEYHVPVNADVPQLDVILVEEDDPYTNPMHIKGIGETAIAGAAAAIANAIYNAVGVRVYDFPITLDKLLYEMPE